MSAKNSFKELKGLDIQNCDVTLAVVKEYKKNRESIYDIKYVDIDNPLAKKLKRIIKDHISQAKSFEEYTYDCPEPEEDQLRYLEYTGTDFYNIYNKLENLNPEVDKIKKVDELVLAKSYMIILRNSEGIQTIGFKKIPENWKMKKSRNFISLTFNENMFKDLEEDNVFSISSSIDFISYQDFLFILSKKNFETALNFRDGMLSKASNLYEELENLVMFENSSILSQKIGNNMRYLRKVSTIQNLGYYKNEAFIKKVKQFNEQQKWGIVFNGDNICITEETIDNILTVLQNKRLFSQLTEEIFDVDSAKPFQSNA